jgi:rhodanese-related sulfurtransferase
MPQTITTGYKTLLDAARREVKGLSVDEARALHGRSDVVFVDIRDPRERDREGKMPGAFSCTRGMLEFWIDPESPYHKPIFAEDKTFVFFCAGGLRSLLAAQTAQQMGLKPVAHLTDGFGGWKKSGAPVEEPVEKPAKA